MYLKHSIQNLKLTLTKNIKKKKQIKCPSCAKLLTNKLKLFTTFSHLKLCRSKVFFSRNIIYYLIINKNKQLRMFPEKCAYAIIIDYKSVI